MFNALARLFPMLPLEDIQEVIAFGGTWDDMCHLLSMYNAADLGTYHYCYDGVTPISAEYGISGGVNHYGG